jgi:hypothetical protein
MRTRTETGWRDQGPKGASGQMLGNAIVFHGEVIDHEGVYMRVWVCE